MKKITTNLKKRLENLLTAPGDELSSWARFIRYQIQLWRFCARRLRDNNAMAMSAALSFRTIFALVPTLVLAFLVLRSVGALQDAKQNLRQLLEASGFSQIVVVHESKTPTTAATGEADESSGADGATTQQAASADTQPSEVINLAERVEKLVERVDAQLTFGRLGPIGVVLLIWTALTLLTTVERSLNRIFEAPRSRSIGRRILLYWSAITLLPIAVTGTVYAGERASGAFESVPGVSWLLVSISWVGPIIVEIFILAAVYMLIPNTKVRFRPAVAGAVIAVPLWLIAKWAFALYIQEVVAKGNLYGALGLFPLFLIWLNLSWLIFLFGAELAHTAANLKRMRSAEAAEKILIGPWELLAAAVAIAKPYIKGLGPVSREQVAEKLNLPEEPVHRIMNLLGGEGIICTVDDAGGEAYVLAKPAESIPVLQILRMRTRDSGKRTEDYDADIAGNIAIARQKADSALDRMTLADVAGERSEA